MNEKLPKPVLTPVEEYNGIYFKRDDLYAPYGENFITGGKIRQCRHLVESNLEQIHKEFNSTITTAASIHSPQNPIVARVAKEFNLKCLIGIGGTTVEKAKQRKGIELCLDLGAEVKILSEHYAFNNVLYSRLGKLCDENPMFKILFGYSMKTHKDSIVDTIADQVQNVDCDSLYVIVGSGVTLNGILEGVMKYNKKFQIIGLQPFGHDRRKTMHPFPELWELTENGGIYTKIRSHRYKYITGKYPYNALLKKNVGFDLDMIYESKGFEMMEKIIKPNEKSCYWVVGNSNIIR